MRKCQIAVLFLIVILLMPASLAQFSPPCIISGAGGMIPQLKPPTTCEEIGALATSANTAREAAGNIATPGLCGQIAAKGAGETCGTQLTTSMTGAMKECIDLREGCITQLMLPPPRGLGLLRPAAQQVCEPKAVESVTPQVKAADKAYTACIEGTCNAQNDLATCAAGGSPPTETESCNALCKAFRAQQAQKLLAMGQMLQGLMGQGGGQGGQPASGGSQAQTPLREAQTLTAGPTILCANPLVVGGKQSFAGTKCGAGFTPITSSVAANLPLSAIPDDEHHLLGLAQRTISHALDNSRTISSEMSGTPKSSLRILSSGRIQESSTGASQDYGAIYENDKVSISDRIRLAISDNMYTLEGFNNLGIINHEGLIELPAGGKTFIRVSNPEGALTTDAEGSIVWHVPGTVEYTGQGYDNEGSYSSDSGLIHINTFTGIVPPYPTSTQTAITGAQTAEPQLVTFTAKKQKAPYNGADVTPEGSAIRIRGNGNFEGVLVGSNRVFPFHFRTRAKGSTHSAYFIGNQLRKDYIIDDGIQQYRITANPVTVQANNKVIQEMAPFDKSLSATEKALLGQ